MQQLTDQSVDQIKDVPRQYLDIALVAGPAMAFDMPTQSVICTYNTVLCICMYKCSDLYSMCDWL